MSMIHIPRLELSYRPQFKCGSDILGIGTIASGAMSYAGTMDTNAQNYRIAQEQMALQKRENQLNRDYNTLEAEKARQFTTSERLAQQQFQREQFDYQTANAIPLAMQGAREAGLNPNVLASHQSIAGGSSVSAPTGASSPAASFSSGLSPVPYQALSPLQGFSQIAQGLASLGQAKKSGVETQKIEQEINNLVVDEQTKKLMLQGVKLDNDLKRVGLKYADRKSLAEIREIFSKVALNESGYDLNVAEQKIKPLLQKLNDALANKHTQEAALLQLQVQSFWKDFNSMLQLRKSQSDAASATASNLQEQTKYQSMVNDIKAAGKTSEIESLIKQFKSSGAVADADAEKALTMLGRYRHLNENDKNAAAEYLNYLFWFIKNEMPSLPIVPFLNVGK